MKNKKDIKMVFNVFVIMLFIALPAVDAVSITNVRTTDVSDRYALVNWETDEPASSLVVYGLNTTQMNLRKSSSVLTKNHTVLISPLSISSSYYYNVTSSNTDGTATSGTYNFTTTAADSIPPFIDTALPLYHDDTELDIKGLTEPNTAVFIEVNGNVSRSRITDNTGEFSFPAVFLRAGTGVTPNQVKVIAIDPSKNRNEASFVVNVDKTPPAITFSEPVQIQNALQRDDRSFAIGQTAFLVKGNSDEPASMEVTAKDDSGKEVFSKRFNISSPWEVSINLPKDGSYTLEFYAVDRAGNIFSESFVLLVDTVPLRIIQTNLNDLNPSYVPITTIRGKVNKPGAVVVALVNNLTTPEATSVNLSAGRITNVPTGIRELIQRSGYVISTRGISQREPLNYVTTADENGNFEIRVELTSEIKILDEEAERLGYSAGASLNHVEVIATDAVGNIARSGEKRVVLTRCGGVTVTGQQPGVSAGSGIFSISSPTPSPGSLPEPVLEAGHGMFSLTMNLQWTGTAERRDVTIHRAVIERQQANRDDLLGKYNLTIGPQGLFRSGTVYPRVGSITPDTKQLYAVVNLRQLTREIFPARIPVGQAVTTDLDFPLQLTLEYSYRLPDGTPSARITQKTCIDVRIQVEPDATHFTQYIPTGLLKATIGALNATLKLIEQTQNIVRQAQTIALYSCGVGIIGQFFIDLDTRIVCRGNDPRRLLQEGKCSYTINQDGSTNTVECSGLPSQDQEQGELCIRSALDTLQTRQYTVRLTCDRIFCPSIPSIPRHAQTYSDLVVRASSQVRQGESTRGVAINTNLGNAASKCTSGGALRLTEDPECRGEFNRAWRWASVFHFPSNSAYDRALQQQTSSRVEITGIQSFFQRAESAIENLCVKEDTDNRYISTGKRLGGLQQGEELRWRVKPDRSNEGYLTYELTLGTYRQIEVDKAQQLGENVINPKSEIEQKFYTPVTQNIIDCFDPTDNYKCKQNRNNCPSNSCSELQGHGVLLQDRLPPEVINQLAFRRSKDYSFDPTSSIVNAARAICLPALNGYLRLYRTQLTQAKLCLETVAAGKENTGVCHAFLSNVICDVVIDALSCIGVTATNLFGSPGTGKEFSFTSVNPFTVITQAGESISEEISGRYGGTAAYRSLFDQNKLVRSVCVGAFTGDWDLGFLSDLMTGAAVTPVRPSCLAAVAQRRFITSDPTKQGKPTYLYHVAGMLTPGAEITSISYQLVCSNDNSCFQYSTQSNPAGRCDCVKQGREIAINLPDVPQNLKIGDTPLDKEIYYPVAAGEYRYDKFRIAFTWRNNQGELVQDKCDAYLREEGVAPSTCSFNVNLGTLRCEFDVGDLGTARFVEKPQTPIDERTGTQKVFYPEDILDFPARIEVISPPNSEPVSKYVRYTIRNQLSNIVSDGYYQLDEGLNLVNINKKLQVSDFAARGSTEIETNLRILEREELPTASTTAKFVVIFQKNDNTVSYQCINYEDATGGRIFQGAPSTPVVITGPVADITCNNAVRLRAQINAADIVPATIPNPGDAISSYTGTKIRVALNVQPGECSTGEVGWSGEAVIYHSSTDLRNNTISPTVPLGTEESRATWNFKAACRRPTGIQTPAAQISSDITSFLVQKENPDLSIPLFNFSQDEKAVADFSINPAGNVTKLDIVFLKDNELARIPVNKTLYENKRRAELQRVRFDFKIPKILGTDIVVRLNATTRGENIKEDSPRKITVRKQ